MHIIAFILFGFVVGLVARALTPGDQRMGFLGTAALGICGSLVGGVLTTLLVGHRWDEPVAAGWIGSIAVAMVLLAATTRWSVRA